MKLRATHQAAFTMIEIAIAIGVIAFALIAIIGVLPSGMQVQRDNREETLIQQDASYLLEAMRGTAQDIPDLHTFVDAVNGQPNPFNNSLDLVRALMSRDAGSIINSTNLYVFRAITGPVVMRATNVPTFRYMVRALVTNSVVNTNFADTNYVAALTNSVFDVRLTFLWPVLPNGELAAPAQKLVMRSVVSGSWDGGNRFTPSDFP